ncbi:hypothetical protein EPA93_25820 [Ktedonosporobacter rubrisoli]|uniref:Uncharacterized protein n=1 Tax=Ktedonosporobacter rubrisoli TaxID=2509675 RepID=A0A4P6JV30_KTERU|nr:hypothetical protein [Ktedonosporobacter rubrisoli]QBD79213.1 hypothetical protein EPA93_25820 [Ktedonosporobacter rubrisoli]
MDVSTTVMTPTQLLLTWGLMGILFIWTFIFAFLALRPARKKESRAQTLTTPVSTISSSAKLHVTSGQSGSALPARKGVRGHEQVGDVGASSVAR